MICLHDIAMEPFSKWRPSAVLDLLWRHHIIHGNNVLCSWHCVNLSSRLV